ncbi:unnamed protein product [Blepharisma stoltei]|uniref:Uncharacterized protein n=1 Tax=Blepharisma stoltei TaxID=1481888 RepID=A0AAU9J2C1_9CILI|nr:unnamed protein product [Blepharisma stoltei]
MEPVITPIYVRDFARKALDLMNPKPQKEEPVIEREPREPVEGPGRKIGLTDYKKWEEFKADEEEEEKKKEEYAKTMCSQDHRKEIELFERPNPEKLEAASQFKKQGNDAFKEKNYSLAALFYRKGLLQLDYTFPENPSEEDKFKELELTLHLNMSLAKFHMDELDETLTHAGQALRVQPNHPKALFRRAQVFFKRDLIDDCRKEVQKILEQNSSNVEAQELLRELDKKVARYKNKEKQIFKAMVSSEEGN